MAAYVFTLLGLLVAGFIYALIYPQAYTEIRSAVAIAAFGMLLVFFFGNATGTRLNRFVGGMLATAVLLVTGLLILGVFQPLFAGLVLVGVFAFAFATVRSGGLPLPSQLRSSMPQPANSGSAVDILGTMTAGLDPAADPLTVLRTWLTADTRLETAAMEAQTAQHILSIQTASAAILRLAGETGAVDAANQAAAKAGIPPNVWQDIQFQLERLRAELMEVKILLAANTMYLFLIKPFES
jgi:hypothetical protein